MLKPMPTSEVGGSRGHPSSRHASRRHLGNRRHLGDISETSRRRAGHSCSFTLLHVVPSGRWRGASAAAAADARRELEGGRRVGFGAAAAVAHLELVPPHLHGQVKR